MTTEAKAISSYALAAKNIRAELKAKFPGVVFSVRSKSFSGGDSITVTWTDGPIQKDVHTIINGYAYGDFDGMTDSYNYRSGFDRSKGSAKYVSACRNASDRAISAIIQKVSEEYPSDMVPSVEDYHSGKLWNVSPILNHGGPGHWDWQSLINRTFSETAF